MTRPFSNDPDQPLRDLRALQSAGIDPETLAWICAIYEIPEYEPTPTNGFRRRLSDWLNRRRIFQRRVLEQYISASILLTTISRRSEKRPISVMLDDDILAHFNRTSESLEEEVNAALRRAIGL